MDKHTTQHSLNINKSLSSDKNLSWQQMLHLWLQHHSLDMHRASLTSAKNLSWRQMLYSWLL